MRSERTSEVQRSERFTSTVGRRRRTRPAPTSPGPRGTQPPSTDGVGETWDPPIENEKKMSARVVCLTVILHPNLSRVGDRARLPALRRGGEPLSISPVSPRFGVPGAALESPLGEPFVLGWRKTRLWWTAGGHVGIGVERAGSAILVEGERVTGHRLVSPEELSAGVVIQLAQNVILLLHSMRDAPRPRTQAHSDGLLGESDAIVELRREIERICDLDIPVLLRGETGAGKEMCARAIHHAGPRRVAELVSVNMAAVQAPLAGSELFGHVRGAFTGATHDRMGLFERAHNGTLFLDEVGDTPPDVQVMLLRVLETGDVLPVGGRLPRHVDVRLVAATNADLEDLITSGQFRAPLHHRLAGYTIRVPALRERRDDIPRLFVHFLRQELATLGEADRIERPQLGTQPLVPASLIRRLMSYHWPGNVRELGNIVRQVAIRGRGAPSLALEPGQVRLLAPRPPGPPKDPTTPKPQARRSERRLPANISEDEMIEALQTHGWRVGRTAEALGIAKSSLYYLMNRSARVRKACEVSAEELQAAVAATGGRLEEMAASLQVSARGIRLRMTELGLL